MKKSFKGSSIVEMVYVMPLVLLVWMLVIFTLFYYHDKNILTGAAYEAAVAGSELWMDSVDIKKQKTEVYFQERIQKKLLFFYRANADIEVNEQGIRVKAEASQRGMHIAIEEYAAITTPEKNIRREKLLEKGGKDANDN